MTEEEGKGKKRKTRPGNQAGNRPSTEEEESSKQLEAEKEENMQTGTSNEAGKKRGRGRPPKQLSVEEVETNHKKKIKRDRDYRATVKLERQVHTPFCKMPGIKDMFEPFNEEFMKINAESLKGGAEQEPALEKSFKQLDEYFRDELIRKWQERFREFFEKEGKGTTEKFKAMLLEVKEKEDTQCSEKMDKILEPSENPEMLEANWKAGPSNIDSNSEGEWQSGTTMMTGGVTNSSSAGGQVGIGLITGTPGTYELAESKGKREEELRKARRGKRPATARNYSPPRPPICGSRPSGFMADARRRISPDKEASISAGAAQSEKRFKKV